MTESTARQKILEISQRLHQYGWLAAADGNISCRVNDSIMITPSGRPKAFLQPSEIVEMDLSGFEKSGQASSEKLMHLTVFRKAPQAQVVIHAHPPTAIALSIARPEWKELPNECLSEMILALGRLPMVPYARPGTAQMGEILEAYLPKHRALILSRHGALSWGGSFEEAMNGMERIEHSARILHLALQVGELTTLPKEEVEYLKQVREKMGEKNL